MERRGDREGGGGVQPGEAQSTNPPDEDEMIEPDADPLDTGVEDADLFVGDEDEDSSGAS